MKLLHKNINPKIQIPIFILLLGTIILVGINGYLYYTSIEKINSRNATHRNYSFDSTCTNQKKIEPRKTYTSFTKIQNPDFTTQKKTYRASISIEEDLLTIYNNDDTKLLQAILSDAYVDTCTHQLTPNGQASLEKLSEDSISLTYRLEGESSLRIVIHFYDSYFTYVPEISMDSSSMLAGQSFLRPIVTGNAIGILNPDAEISTKQGIFQQIKLPASEQQHFTTSILWQPQHNDNYIFSPTTDAWFVTSENTTILHGLTEINRASGIDIIVPPNGTEITYHYANISDERALLTQNIPFRGMQSIVIVTQSNSAVDAFQQYYDALTDLDLIPENTYKAAQWWNGGIYCNWFEYHDIKKTTQDEIEKALTALEQNNITIKTIVIDEGWAAFNGDWTENKDRFPDGIRSYIDSLHNRGYKVMLHFIPFSVRYTDIRESDSPLLPALQTITRSNIDYSDSKVRNYLRSAIERMLSDGQDGYNADGFKLDFVFKLPQSHSSVQYHDPSWGRGEDYLHNSLKWIYETAKEIKPDALIVGEGVNPFFQDAYDANRTNDISSETILNGALNREKIQQILMPQLFSFNDLLSKQTWDFTESARQFAFSTPHIVFKVRDLSDQDIQEAACLSKAYNLIKNDLTKKQIEDPFSKNDGINADGKIIWNISDDGNTVRATSNGEVFTCQRSQSIDE